MFNSLASFSNIGKYLAIQYENICFFGWMLPAINNKTNKIFTFLPCSNDSETIFMFIRSPHNTESEAIIIHAPKGNEEALAYVNTLLASGFERHPYNRRDYYKLLPCPEGTFFNSSSRGEQGCIKCPAGTMLKFTVLTFITFTFV